MLKLLLIFLLLPSPLWAAPDMFSFAESLGGVESLMTLPAVQTHADIPEAERLRLGICERLLRLSVGTESPEDIIADLEQALA